MVQSASERFGSRMHNLVGADVAMLSKGLAADVAVVGPLARMSALVGLEVAKLAEALPAGRFFADEWLDARVRAGVDFEVGLLVKVLAAAGHVALIAFLRGSGGGEGGGAGGC